MIHVKGSKETLKRNQRTLGKLIKYLFDSVDRVHVDRTLQINSQILRVLSQQDLIIVSGQTV